MTEKGATYPIKKKDLDKHVEKVNEHMEMIRKGGALRYNLFDLVRGIGGDKHMMAKEVSDTIEALRRGFALFYEIYALMEERVEDLDGGIGEEEKRLFLGAYSMFAAGSYVSHKLRLMLEERETIEVPRKEDYFQFHLRKDDLLNAVLARYHGLVNRGKRNGVLDEAIDLPRGSVEFFLFLAEEASEKRKVISNELTELVETTEFRVNDEYSLAGFEVSFEERGVERVEFVPVEPRQVAGNVLAKKEMLRDMDRIVLFDREARRNPILDVGGLSWSVLYDGLPGTGKSSIFRMGLTRLDARCRQVGSFWKSKNMGELLWKQLIIDQSIKDEYYGKTGKNLLAILEQAKKVDKIYIITTDDIDLLVSGDRGDTSGGSDRDILNILMQYADGINTVIRGNVQWWAATNDATTMDPALRQRFISRYSVDGPREWFDFADITYDKLKGWIEKGIVDVTTGGGYVPYEMRKGETGYEEKLEKASFVSAIEKRLRGKVTLKEIGELCEEMKGKNPRFTGRAVHAVSEAIKKRINDYDIPEEWYEKPDLFFLKDYATRVDMLKELCRKVTGETIVYEFKRYFESEERYASDKFESDVEKTIHQIKVHDEARKKVEE